MCYVFRPGFFVASHCIALKLSVLCSAIAPWISFGLCPVVLFGLWLACSIRDMPACKFGSSGFVRHEFVSVLCFHQCM
jgi:hypothetical protein